jgi:hypothetical protein
LKDVGRRPVAAISVSSGGYVGVASGLLRCLAIANL